LYYYNKSIKKTDTTRELNIAAEIECYIKSKKGNKRSYLIGKLTQNLDKDSTYVFECRIRSLSSHFAPNQLDMAFCDSVDTISYHVKPKICVSLTQGKFLPDSVWTPITIRYTAHGNEKFLVIGNFHNDAHTRVSGNGPISIFSRILIDDIFVYRQGTAKQPPVHEVNSLNH
jgi:hypothetical protein